MVERPSWVTGFGGQEFKDGYADISPDDSDLWLRLISRSYEIDPELAAKLKYIRDTGAKLIRSPEYGYRIEPVIGPNGWDTQEEYERERAYLVKYRGQMLGLLKGMEK